MMKGLYEHQQQTKKITPLLPISLALEPISVTNNDNIIVSDNNNGITYNNDNPSGTELLEQNGNKVCLIAFFKRLFSRFNAFIPYV